MERTVKCLIRLPENVRGVPILNEITGESERTSSSKLILFKDSDGSYRPISEKRARQFYNAKSRDLIDPDRLRVGKTYVVVEQADLLAACM